MKTTVERTFCTILLLSFINFIGCTTAPTKSVVTDSYKNFATETKSNEYYKVVLKSMNRGEYLMTMSLGGDAALYDAIYFDVEVYNIHPDENMIVYYDVFRLIADDGSMIDCCGTGWKGAFDGDTKEIKTNLLEPGSKKAGFIGFPMKKSCNPTKLIFNPSFLDISAKKIVFDLP